MSSGKEIVKFVISSTINGEYVIVDAPKDMLENGFLDGCFCCDNAFTNEELIPQEKGLYEVSCEYYWDDGKNAFFEHTDPEYEFKIIKVIPLYQVTNLLKDKDKIKREVNDRVKVQFKNSPIFKNSIQEGEIKRVCDDGTYDIGSYDTSIYNWCYNFNEEDIVKE